MSLGVQCLQPCIADRTALPHAHTVLGDMTYDFIPIASPVANGGTLQFLTWLLTESPLSTTLLRYLLFNKNGFWKLRSLGSQMKSVEPLYYPMMQLSQSVNCRALARRRWLPGWRMSHEHCKERFAQGRWKFSRWLPKLRSFADLCTTRFVTGRMLMT